MIPASDTDTEADKARMKWWLKGWLKGWLRAYQESRFIHHRGKAGIRGLLAVERSKRLVP